MFRLEALSSMIADEILSAPEAMRADIALQIAAGLVEMTGYDRARTGTVETSETLLRLAIDIDQKRHALSMSGRPDSPVMRCVAGG